MRKVLALLWAVTLLACVSLIPPDASAAYPASVAGEGGKVSVALEQAFTGNESVSYLVFLREKADPVRAASDAGAAAVRRGVPAPDVDVAARAGVVRKLQETANLTQAGILSALEQSQRDGRVSAYRAFYIVNALAVTSTEEIMWSLANRPEVERLILDETHGFLPPPDKANAAKPAAEGAVPWNIQKIGAPAVWAEGIDGSGVVVATMDSGAEWTHPALMSKWQAYDSEWGGPGALLPYSWYDPIAGEPLPVDENYHGTHVLGTILGSEYGGINQIGVAPGARWIAVRVFDGAGNTTDSALLDGAQWLIAPGGEPAMAPDVINCSWGAGPGLDDWFQEAVVAWRAAGIVPVFSAGNDGPGAGTVSAPGNYPESIAVGAVDSGDTLAGFSSRGPAPYDSPDDLKPELVAPGVDIRSSIPGGSYEGSWNGTSMAAPHVTGTIALMLQADPGLNADEIEEILTTTALRGEDDLYSGVPNYGYGWGRLDAEAAVRFVRFGATGVVSGHILTEGEDAELPWAEHDPITEVYEGFDVPLTVEAGDNIAVLDVRLNLRQTASSDWTAIAMKRASGDAKRGFYSGSIPYGFLDKEADLEYSLEVLDYGGNIRRIPEEGAFRVNVEAGVRPGYYQDFESAPVGWLHGGDNDTWEWGTPTSVYGPRGGYSGQRVFGIGLKSDYMSNANAWLMAPPIDLTDGSPAILSFWQWRAVEPESDVARIMISIDGQNWSELKRYGSRQREWQRESIDLSAYQGQLVYMMFNLVSDYYWEEPGWFIDDVKLIGPDQVPPEAPSHLEATELLTGGVSLAWNGPANEDVNRFNVYRSGTSGSGFELIGQTSVTSFQDVSPMDAVPNYYAVAAVDLGNNESALSPVVAVTPHMPDVLLTDDMEAGAPGWTHGGTLDSWQLGTPMPEPAPHSGANVWATNLTGNYDPSADCWLQAPAIDLTGYQTAALSFWHWYSTFEYMDYCHVEVSSDGGTTWTKIATYAGQRTSWNQALLDLTPYTGAPVMIRFRLFSEFFEGYPGWYIDDVRVVGTRVDASAAESTPAVKVMAVDAPKFSLEALRTNRQVVEQGIVPGYLPVEGVIAVLETGKQVRADPVTGDYSLIHPEGQYTLTASAYGYYPETEAVTISGNTPVSHDFVLRPVPRGTIRGVVTDGRTGEPLAGAMVYVVEDPYLPAYVTGEDGSFSIPAMIGSYTLHVSAASHRTLDVSVTVNAEETTEVAAALERYIGNGMDLVYDTGVIDSYQLNDNAGDALAVRMSAPVEGAMVNTIRFHFGPYPSPGGSEFAWAIYDASGPDGLPGNMVAGPVIAEALRDGNWTEIDLSRYGIAVYGDFYVAYVQTKPLYESPGLSADSVSAHQSYRGFRLTNGMWKRFMTIDGPRNLFIQANVTAGINKPVIVSPIDGSALNTPEVTVRGFAPPGYDVNIYLNGRQVGAAFSTGTFEYPLVLTEGENLIGVDTGSGGQLTDLAIARVSLDTLAPALVIPEGVDGSVVGEGTTVFTVVGTDEHLEDTLRVSNGDYSAAVRAEVSGNEAEWNVSAPLNEGRNEIVLAAEDTAGNRTEKTVIILLDQTAPVLLNVAPGADLQVRPGDTVAFEFDGESGLWTQFAVDTEDGIRVQNYTAMTEDAVGHYTASWVVPGDLSAQSLRVLFLAVDPAGNETEVEASGRIVVSGVAGGPRLVMTSAPGEYATNGRDTVASGRRFRVSGKVECDERISAVRINNRKVRVDAAGNFSLDVTLREGENRVVVKAVDIKGREAFAEYFVVMDSRVSLSGTRAQQISSTHRLQVTGRTDPEAEVTVTVKQASGAGEVVDELSGTADSQGRFTLINSADIPAGRYRVTITAVDDYGNTASRTTTISLRYLAPVLED